jgi:type II secretory pathway component GspD/PulD (secretin)
MESVNLKDFEMKNIIQKLAEWTGKVIIPDDEAMKIKITIYSPQEVSRVKALSLIYSALQNKGIIVEETDDVIYLKPISKARLTAVPTIPADYPLAAIENKDQVVQKFFEMKNYSPTQMSSIVLPLVGEHGTVIADEGASTLLVIDTVRSLIRIERIIGQFDIPGATETVEEIFRIHDGDPAEIAQLLEILMGQSKRDRGRSGRREAPRREPGKDEAAKSVIIESKETPIILIPLQQRKWIIAKGSAEDVNQIGKWIERLDRKEKIESEYETVSITYADVREVADRLSRSLRQTPGTELRTSVLVEPLSQSRQILIFGRPELREMVKKLLAEIDVPPGTFEEKVFNLKHADAEEIKKKLDELYGEQDPSGRYDYYYYRYGRQENPQDKVRVIAYPITNQVNVIASPENMRKIEKQIEEWDIPLNV